MGIPYGVGLPVTNLQPHDKIVIIGAGMGGIAMAVQLKRLLKHQNFELFEKSEDIGGTWS